MGKLKFGVIGAAGGQGGGWAQKINDWGKSEVFDIELSAVCDINKGGIEKKAKELCCKAYTDYKQMYNEEKLDAVVIATPHYLHAPMAIDAAEQDMHILVEKPMCITLKQADDMRKAVRKNGVMLAVGLQHRFDPSKIALKTAISSGDLGNIFQINGFFRDWRTEMYYETSTQVSDPNSGKKHGWRGHWSTEGGGSLANQEIHFLDSFQWIASSPIRSVQAISRVAKHTFPETDDNTNAILEFDNGAMGLLQAGVSYEYGEENEIGVYGTNGALITRKDMRDKAGNNLPLLDFRNEELKKKKPLHSYIPSILNGSMQMFAAFLEAIEEDDESLISVNVEEGRKSVELTRAIFLSVIMEKKITFPVHDPGIFPSLAHVYKDPMFP